MSMDYKSTGVLYCRYSSHAQREVSIDQQVKACKQYAESNGIKILKVYDDRAMTGTNDRRPKFQQMISEAEHMDYQYIIVYSLDRFARDRYDSAVYKRQLKNYGKRVMSATEHISDDPTGVLMEAMLEGWNEYYSKELSRKIRRGMVYNAERCLANGKQPYGYMRAPDGTVAIQEDEAAIVREIFGRVSNGEAFADILRSLNDRGLKTKTGHEWTNSSFNSMLQNERYIGVYAHSGVRIEGGAPAIIDRELFDRVQYRLRTKKNPRSPQKRRRENGVYLLTGKIFCGECLSPMIGMSGTGRHGALHFYYVCKGHRERSGCGRKPVRRDDIELEVASAIRKYILTDESIVILADAAVARQATRKNDTGINMLRAELADVQKAIRNIVSAIEKGIVANATQQRLAELEQEEQELAERIANDEYLLDQDYTREEYIALLKLYQEGDVTDKRYQETLFDAFLIAVYVYDDKLRIKFNLGDKHDEDVEIDLEAEPEEGAVSDCSTVRISTGLGHQTSLIRTIGMGEATIIAVGRVAFLLTCPRK